LLLHAQQGLIKFVSPIFHLDEEAKTPCKMKIAIAATLIASASAFAPVAQKASSSALSMSFENEIGAQPPLGFWDPLGLLNDADEAKFARLREVETKHGRIAQLAILGHLVTTAGYTHTRHRFVQDPCRSCCT
jgi:hypothetical protein